MLSKLEISAVLTWQSNSPVFEAVFALVSRLSCLRVLRLPVLWTRAVVESLAPLRHLQHVDIHGGFVVTDVELALIARQFCCLKSVTLHACWAVTEIGLRQFVHSLPLLETLKLKVNSNLPLNDERSERARNCGAAILVQMAVDVKAYLLTVLCLHFVPIETEQLSQAVKCFTRLKKLSVSNCENLLAVDIENSTLQKMYLFNLWGALYVRVHSSSLRLLNIDHGMESLEAVEVTTPRLRKLVVDGSNVLHTIHIHSERLIIAQLVQCQALDMRSLKDMLRENQRLACLKLGRVSEENLFLDEVCCPSLQELCLLSDFACNAVHVRSRTLRLLQTETGGDLVALNHLYLVADHICKISLVGVPALRSICVQCISVDAIELNLCSDDQLCLESCVIQALGSIGFLRVFDCKVNLLSVNTPLARTIVLYRCQMSDYVLQMALTGCQNIAYLNLEKCQSLTHVDIQAPPMKYLNMFGCADILRLDLKCPELIGINIGHCPNVHLFIEGREQKLGPKSQDGRPIQVVFPSQSIRWSHDFPPKPYPST